MAKNYNFGEKKVEKIKGKDCPVWQTPTYLIAKNKAIEMIESGKYELAEGDFWILMNTYAGGTKVMYSGLILSHNGCLKINDVLESKFDPMSVSENQNGYNNSLVFTYCNKEQGIYEVGEVSNSNCKNDYPYAMAFKRCFDRVVLKLSKLAYSGIYSDSESDDFKQDANDYVEKQGSGYKEQKPSVDYKEQNKIYIQTICSMTNRDIADVQKEALQRAGSKNAEDVCDALVNWITELNDAS